MHCPTCGARNDDNARFCVNCGQKLEAEESLPGDSSTSLSTIRRFDL